MKKQKKPYRENLEVSETSRQEVQAMTVCELGDLAEVSKLLCQCLKEEDTLKQCALLRKAGTILQGTECGIESLPPNGLKKCLRFLAEVFVTCNINNPSRKIVASIFDNFLEQWCSDVLSIVVLDKLSSSMEILNAGKAQSVRHDVDMISDMLEFFAQGTNVLLCSGYLVVQYLSMCLNKKWKDARSESSPTLQTAFMWDCLVTIKTIIAFLQKLSIQKNLCCKLDQLTLSHGQMENTPLPADCRNQICSNHHEDTKPLKDIMIEMLSDLCAVMFDDQFFPDCRITAGMAILVVLKVLCPGDAFVPTVGKLIFPSHVKPGETIQSVLDDPKIMSIFQTSKDSVNFSHLCLCRGVLSMVPLQALTQDTEFILNAQGNLGTLMFDALFPDLCSLCDGLKESSSCLLAFRTLTLWAHQARQIAASRQCQASWMKEILNGTSPVATKLLNYVWTNWDHPVEGVRYQTKMIFEHVVNTHLIVAEFADYFLRDLTASLLKVGWHVRGKYGPLGCMASVLRATKMLLWFPNIPQDVFPLMKDRGLVPHVMDFLDKMTNSHKQEIMESGKDVQEWLKIWMIPLLYQLQHGCIRMREHLAQYCLPKLLKCYPESLQYLVEHLQDNTDITRNLGTLITCLKTARSSGLISFEKKSLKDLTMESSSLWCGVVPVELMRKALCHLDDQIRLAALGLLCESPRSTESISELDLQLLKIFVPANMNNQSPSFRQQAAAQVKKECIRICGKNTKHGKNIHEKPFIDHQLAVYKEFLDWFCGFQFDSLFPGASSTRRTTALSNLMLIKQIFSCTESAASPNADRFDIIEVFNQDGISVLLGCLKDSYEHNKMMAYDLLKAVPPHCLPFQEEVSLCEWINMVDRLISSPRAVDSSSAAMFLRLFVERCSIPLKFNMNITASHVDEHKELLESVPCVQAFRVLVYLTDLLKSHYSVASRNLSLIGIQAPMHGVLFCLRSIIGSTSLRYVAADKHWQNLISCLVEECLKTANIVAPVITNESPEGLTADGAQEAEEDFIEIPEQFDDMLQSSAIDAPASQLLLVCCWRTMKEVALLLGELSENAPLQVDEINDGLLTVKQLQTVGVFFTKVLLTSKHRGAFELAYTGFVKLCTVVWSSAVKDLRQLPEQWLQSLLDDLTSATPLQALCGTRRSAGVPFFILAIVTTEPCAAGRACFKRVMTELLQIALKPVDESRIQDSTLPQVHACNILRAMYRETKLGEDVFPFVSDGVVVAVTGFHSNSWAMRNSSTLLFSALVTRMFGVKRAKDEHSKKNCMTGREFFSRYPDLHSFLLGQLQAACQGIDRENNVHPSLYPVLVILSRLYPSTMDGVDSVLNMAKFVPLVVGCRQSMVIKTRMISARALVPLVSGDLFVQILFSLITSLPVSPSDEVKQNYIHGTLLHIYHLLDGHAQDGVLCIKKKLIADILPLLKHSAWLGTGCNTCALSRSVFLDIVLHFVVDWSWFKHSDSDLNMLARCDLQALKQCFENLAVEEILNKKEQMPSVIGGVFVKKALAGICLQVCKDYTDPTGERDNKKVSSKYSDVIQTLLRSSEYEVRSVVLEFVLSQLPSVLNNSLECEVALDTNSSTTSSWTLIGLQSAQFKTQLFTMAIKAEQHVDCLVKVLQLLSHLPGVLSFPWTLSSGEQISAFECWNSVAGRIKAPSQRATLKCALLQFLSRVVSVIHERASIEDAVISSQALKSLAEFSAILQETSSPSESVELRLCTAQVLGHINVTDTVCDYHGKLGDVPFVLWSVVVTLLSDDEPLVREQMALSFSMLLKRVQTSETGSGLLVEGSCPVVPPVALESAIRSVWSLFIDHSPVVCVSWMMECILGDLTCESCNQEGEMSDADRLFEKGPLNIYTEDCIISRMACQAIQQGVETNNGATVLKKHRTELLEFLQIHYEECLDFVERLLSKNWPSDSYFFALFYRVLAKICATVILIQRLSGNISLKQSQIGALLSAVKSHTATKGISFHSMIKDIFDKLSMFTTI
ncbi:tRNA (32-2'-O)-methyltransferase regulator THADA-like isoform X3 [Montipora foliosa]|uniref:tRNA (32-2'-O)-methyltransferase regulator THADA-like isoform X3 n=1 Tax=Montipora foliosa TaxID=591990 RepID=UPI0035F1B137